MNWRKLSLPSGPQTPPLSSSGRQLATNSNMMSPAVSPGDSPTQQRRNAGVPPPPAHVAPNAAAIVGPPDYMSFYGGRRPPMRLIDFMSGQREGSPDQFFPDDSGIPLPPPVQRRPMGGRRAEDSPDLFSPNSSSRRPGPAQGRSGATPAGHSWLPVVVGFFLLTFNSATAAYRSWRDPGAIFFVASTYFTMVSLFFSIKKFKAAPPNSRRKKGLRVCVWVLTMSLTFGFVYQITETTAKPTLQLALLLWAMPAATGVSVFIIFWDRSSAPLGEELLDIPPGEELPDPEV